MSEWTENTVKDLEMDGILLVQDGNHGEYRPRRDEFSNEGTHFIRAADMKDGKILFSNAQRINPIAQKRIRKGIGKTNDVILSHKGTVGKVAFAPPNSPGFICSPQTTFWRSLDHSKINPRYLYFHLHSTGFTSQLRSLENSSDMAAYVSLTSQRGINLLLPPIKEQEAIAAALGALDDKIAANARISSSVDSLAGALFTKVLTSSTGTQESKLASIAKVNTQSIKKQSEGKLRYLDIASVGIGSHEWPGLIDWIDAPGRARRLASPGDTIWSTVRPNRRSHALLMDSDPNLVVSTGLAVLTPHNSGPAFLYESTRTHKFQTYLENAAEGSAYPAVNSSKFLEAPVVLPTTQEMQAFEETAMPLRKRAHQATVESRTLAELRDTLLPQLMSGKLRVKDAEKIVEDNV